MIKKMILIAGLCLISLAGNGGGCSDGPVDGTGGANNTTGGNIATGGSSVNNGGSLTSGGSLGTGGSLSSTGGSKATGGQSSVATGGLAATGGASTIIWPPCENATTFKIKQIPQVKFGWKPIANNNQCKLSNSFLLLGANQPNSSLWGPNKKSSTINLDQGQVGACTGFATEGCLSFNPFTRTASNTEGLLIYTDATNLDNNCSYNATPIQCPKAYNPKTGAHDNGSVGASALQVAQDLGFITGWGALNTIAELEQMLQIETVIFGSYWYNDSMNTGNCGQISLTGGIAGGHEFLIAGVDIVNKKIWAVNSWGNWGLCLNGKCGYFYLTFDQFQTLLDTGGEINYAIK